MALLLPFAVLLCQFLYLASCTSLRAALAAAKDEIEIIADENVVDLTKEEFDALQVLSGFKRSLDSDWQDEEEVIFVERKKKQPINGSIGSFLNYIENQDYLNLAEACKELRGKPFKLSINHKIETYTLHYAVAKNDMTMLRIFLENLKPDLDLVDAQGHTALSLSIALKRSGAFTLLAPRSNIDGLIIFGGLSALHYAAMRPGSEEYLAQLISLGGDYLLCCKRNGWTPFVYAALKDFEGNFDFLVQKLNSQTIADAKNGPLLHVLMHAGEYEKAERIITFGFPCTFTDRTGKNILHLAARLDACDVLDALLANVNHKTIVDMASQQDKCNELLPIDEAAVAGHLTALKRLLPIPNQNLGSLFAICVEGNRLEMLKFLIDEKVVSPSDWDDWNGPSLAFAYMSGHGLMFEYLLSIIPEPEWYGSEEQGNNILQLAARIDDLETVEMLIGRGMDVNEVDNYESASALAWAVAHKNEKMVKVLLKAGAQVEEALNCEIFEEFLDEDEYLKIADAKDLFELAKLCSSSIYDLLVNKSGIKK